MSRGSFLSRLSAVRTTLAGDVVEKGRFAVIARAWQVHAASRAGVAAAADAAAIAAALRDDVDAEDDDAIAAVKDIVSEYGGETEVKLLGCLLRLPATQIHRGRSTALAHTDTDTDTINLAA